ncbi:hypothetical protein [Streptomyces tsukubensis]|uniref:hypothetical protein n=1 Tax=Streptomyces tsukubensis TaxID=83656 RepID=UPI0034502670
MSYDEIEKTEKSTPHLVGRTPEHSLHFKSADGSELVSYWVEGTLPIPAVGDVIGLHWSEVVVTAVQTRYGKDEDTGRAAVYTTVSVDTPPSD